MVVHFAGRIRWADEGREREKARRIFYELEEEGNGIVGKEEFYWLIIKGVSVKDLICNTCMS
jgi:hypothetical protein